MGFGDNKSTFSFTPSYLGTAWLPWFTAAVSNSLVRWSQGTQPALASPFLERPDSKWTSKCKGISKKCSFRLRSKILPQSMTTFWAFLSILSVPWRKGGQNTNSTTTLTTPRVLSAPWFTLYDPQILVIMCTQSSKCCEWSAEYRVPEGDPRAIVARTSEKTPLSSSMGDHCPKRTAGCIPVENSPRLQGLVIPS